MDPARKKILAVDNEPSVTVSFQYVFPKPAYDLTCVDSGDAALRRIEGGFGPYDVIIVDQKMPHLSGIELVEAIRQRGIDTKVIVVSAHLSSDVRDAYERMGVQFVFGKPFNIDELRTAVDRLSDLP